MPKPSAMDPPHARAVRQLSGDTATTANRGQPPAAVLFVYLSISPNTTSMVPMMVTTSASMAPLLITSIICGGEVETK